MIEHAQQYIAAGLCALPADRSEKRPLVSWKQFQCKLPNLVTMGGMFDGADAICIVCGHASGGLELIDFDHGAELYDAWRLRIPPELFAKLVIETSQSGGRHVVYRCAEPSGNLKLAQRKTEEGLQTLIETRGEGGLFICSPTKGYEIKQGDLTKPPVLTNEERETLLQAAWQLNEHWPEPVNYSGKSSHGGELRPGDDYNQRGDVRELLKSHGWRPCGTQGDGNERWTRPGKKHGISATLKDGNFYVFSTSAYPFEGNECYSPFAVYALLEHAGNFAAASDALRFDGFGEQPKPESGVDISGLLNSLLNEKVDSSDPGPIPEHLFDVPGFVSDLMKFTLSAAPYPNRPLAFCGALAMLSYLTGRKVRTSSDMRSNIYLLALAASGTGKDFPRRINVEIAQQCGFLGSIGEAFASGEGLQDALAKNPAMLFQCDEFDGMMRQIKLDRDGVRESIPNNLMKFYTTSNSTFPMRAKSGAESRFIYQPHLTVFGTATPKHFYEALSERILTNGLFSRMMIVDVGERGQGQEPRSAGDLPESVKLVAKHWSDYNPSGNLGVDPNPRIVEMSLEAKEAVAMLRQRADDEYTKANNADDEIARTAWSRTCENATKLALLYACSKSMASPQIDAEAVSWATEFAMHQTRRQLFMAATHCASNPFHEQCQRALRIIKSHRGGVDRSKLLKAMRCKARELDEITNTLRESQEIRITERKSLTKTAVSYVRI